MKPFISATIVIIVILLGCLALQMYNKTTVHIEGIPSRGSYFESFKQRAFGIIGS
jgi:hypothetical protein